MADQSKNDVFDKNEVFSKFVDYLTEDPTKLNEMSLKEVDFIACIIDPFLNLNKKPGIQRKALSDLLLKHIQENLVKKNGYQLFDVTHVEIRNHVSLRMISSEDVRRLCGDNAHVFLKVTHANLDNEENNNSDNKDNEDNSDANKIISELKCYFSTTAQDVWLLIEIMSQEELEIYSDSEDDEDFLFEDDENQEVPPNIYPENFAKQLAIEVAISEGFGDIKTESKRRGFYNEYFNEVYPDFYEVRNAHSWWHKFPDYELPSLAYNFYQYFYFPEQIKSLQESGLEIKEIAKQLGTTSTKINNSLNKKPGRFEAKELNELIKFYETGFDRKNVS